MSTDKNVFEHLYERTAARAASQTDVEEFLASLDDLPRYVAIRVYLVFHEGDVLDFLARKADRSPNLATVNEPAGTFSLHRTYGRKHVRSVDGLFSVLGSSVDSVDRLVSVSRSEFWNAAVRRLVRGAYPGLVPVFFRQAEMRRALKEFQRSLGPEYRLMVQEVSMKEPRDAAESPAAWDGYDSDRKWTDRTVDDAFDIALERRQWFTRIRFLIEKQEPPRLDFVPVASCGLSKYGHLQVSARYSDFADHLLPALETVAHQRMMLYSHRGMRELNYESAAPLEITYPTDVFAKRDGLERFTATLMKHRHATKALFHTNPYLHASVADFIDGSAIEVWVLSPRRILLIPQAKASIAALDRLTTHIFSEFQEGQVGVYSGDE